MWQTVVDSYAWPVWIVIVVLAAVVGLAIAIVISVYLDDGLHPFWAYVLSALGGAVPIALITLMIGVPLSDATPAQCLLAGAIGGAVTGIAATTYVFWYEWRHPKERARRAERRATYRDQYWRDRANGTPQGDTW
jgi:hypothetical protein